MKSSSAPRFFFRVILGGPAAPPGLDMKVGLAKAPPDFFPAEEKPKLGLLVDTDFCPVPYDGRIVGFVESAPPPPMFAISPAIKSSTLSLPNLVTMMFQSEVCLFVCC